MSHVPCHSITSCSLLLFPYLHWWELILGTGWVDGGTTLETFKNCMANTITMTIVLKVLMLAWMLSKYCTLLLVVSFSSSAVVSLTTGVLVISIRSGFKMCNCSSYHKLKSISSCSVRKTTSSWFSHSVAIFVPQLFSLSDSHLWDLFSRLLLTSFSLTFDFCFYMIVCSCLLL